jgi:hypothetical protein
MAKRTRSGFFKKRTRKWYAVFVGRRPGVFNELAKAYASQLSYPGGCWASYSTEEEAIKAYEDYSYGCLNLSNEDERKVKVLSTDAFGFPNGPKFGRPTGFTGSEASPQPSPLSPLQAKSDLSTGDGGGNFFPPSSTAISLKPPTPEVGSAPLVVGHSPNRPPKLLSAPLVTTSPDNRAQSPPVSWKVEKPALVTVLLGTRTRRTYGVSTKITIRQLLTDLSLLSAQGLDFEIRYRPSDTICIDADKMVGELVPISCPSQFLLDEYCILVEAALPLLPPPPPPLQ